MPRRARIEFGDFQTPESLAETVCRLLHRGGVRPASIVEPTCGVGSFVRAALSRFPRAARTLAVDINSEYLRQLRRRLRDDFPHRQVAARRLDFFKTDWRRRLAGLPEPVLVIGNPPWVSNARQGRMGGSNLPVKQNSAGLPGIEAITGKSNFDISEWMILRLLESLAGRRATLAMLCKTRVARKILAAAWRQGMPLSRATLHHFDAASEFRVAVDACLLTCHLGRAPVFTECPVFPSLKAVEPERSIGFRQDRLIADLDAFRRCCRWSGTSRHRWRSGIKHDCAKVMELRPAGKLYVNGLGQRVELEGDFVYPLLKGSQVARGSCSPDRCVLVPQRHASQPTDSIRDEAPRTWDYLQSHAARLDARASAIYRNRPRFSVFGVGPYSFAPWKVAISGLYKRLHFAKVGCHNDKPIVLDDTCYFVSCSDEREASRVSDCLNSEAAAEFFSAHIFWDQKRPITADALSLLDVEKLLADIGASGGSNGGPK